MDDPDKETPEESTRKKETSEEKKQNNGDLEMEKLFKELENELIRTGYGKSSIIKTYKVDSLHDMSKLQLKDALGRLKKCTDKKVSNEA